MKRIVLFIVIIVTSFAILLPFASKTPDGVQNLVASNQGSQQPSWKGLMENYSIAFANPYISTLVAGLIGIAFVLGGSYVLSISVAHKKRKIEGKINN